MSLLDTALDRRQAFHREWDAQRVSELRQAIELGMFDLPRRSYTGRPPTIIGNFCKPSIRPLWSRRCQHEL